MANAKRKALDHDLAVGTNPWTRLLYKENATAEHTLKAANAKHPDSAVWGTMVRELFADAYGIGNSEVEVPSEHKGWADDLLKKVRDLPEWNEAIKGTEGDDIYAARLAGRVADAMAFAVTPPDVAQQNEDKPEPPAGSDNPQRGEPGQGGEGESEDGEPGDDGEPGSGTGSGNQPGEFKLARERGAVKRMKAAIAGATKDQEACDEATAMVAKVGAGNDLSVKDVRDVKRSLSRVKGDKMARIAKMAGRMRESARKAQKEKKHGPGAIEDITRGGDLMQLLPSERVKMGDPVMGPMLWANVMDHAALQFDVKVAVNEKGPIVFCIDKSGSMDGDSDEYAIAAMLSMMEIARKQRRVFAVIEFDHIVQATTKFAKPGKPDPKALAAIIARRADGGTNIQTAIEHARNFISEEKAFKKADVVLLTDGEDQVDWKQQVADFKKAGVELHFVGIGTSAPGQYNNTTDSYDAVDFASATEVTYDDIENTSAEPFATLFAI